MGCSLPPVCPAKASVCLRVCVCVCVYVFVAVCVHLYACQLDVLRQAKEAAVKSCGDQRREVESLMEQLSSVKEKLASTKQQLQVNSEII